MGGVCVGERDDGMGVGDYAEAGFYCSGRHVLRSSNAKVSIRDYISISSRIGQRTSHRNFKWARW